MTEHVYTVTVGRGAPVGICGSLADAEQLVARYLRMCWPKAEARPAEKYLIANRSERYHRIPPGNYSGGEMLPVTVECVRLWETSDRWPS